MKLKIISVIFIIFTGLITAFASAQTAEDFTLTSTDGITFNLYEQLDSGKIVILNFFSVGCPSCQENTPHLDSIWQAYGYNGDSLWVWGIESYNADSAQIESFRQQFGATFPCFSTKNDTEVLGLYNITYTPQYYITCPVNHTSKKISFESIENYIESCKSELYTNTKINNQKKPKFLIFQSGNLLNMVNQENSDLYLSILKINGQTIYSEILPKNSNKEYLLKQGIYIIKLNYDSHFSQTTKIIVP